jgi:hypothetical protein
MRPPSVTTVRNVVYACIALTLFHFTDNAVFIDDYPKASWQPDWFAAVVVVGWFVFTATGIAAYRAYRRGDFRLAHPLLLLYAYMVMSSLGHFLYGSPSELTTRGAVSVFVDVVAGAAVLVVAAWSITARRQLSGSRSAAS